MTNILRVDATIKTAGSVSRRLTDRIVTRLTATVPGATVTERDLTQSVAPIDAAWLAAVYSPADARTPEQGEIAAKADEYLDEIRAADIIVIGLPIYNFGVPAHMKAWIDQLARKGETFTYTESGPVGLLTGKRAIVALSSDGTGFGSEIDFASGYLRHVLGFFGITDVEFVAADKMVFAPAETLSRAEAAVDAIAA